MFLNCHFTSYITVNVKTIQKYFRPPKIRVTTMMIFHVVVQMCVILCKFRYTPHNNQFSATLPLNIFKSISLTSLVSNQGLD